jgi:diguanylate cyclase (GGDEF)-like protein/PAS domain S-box-containing protein
VKAKNDRNSDRRVEIIHRCNLLKKNLFLQGILPDKLKHITEEIITIFDAAFAGIWLLKPGDLCEKGCVHVGAGGKLPVCRVHEQCLHLAAASGHHTPTDGFHERIPLGLSLIGCVVSGQESRFLSNDVASVLTPHDHQWSANLDLASFAGYRLVLGDNLPMCVLGCFSTHAIGPEQDALLEGLSVMAGQVLQVEAVMETLQESRENFRDLFENVSDFLYSHDLQGNLKEANLAFRKAFGYTQEDIKHKNVRDIMPERYHKDFDDYMRDILRHKKNEGFLKVVAKDGSERIVEYKNSIISGPDGPVGIRGSARDITDNIRDKKELARSEERFQLVVENAQEWVWEMNAGGLYTYANSVVEKIMGYKAAEIRGRKYFYDFFLPEEQAAFKQATFRTFEKKQRFHDHIYRAVHKSGKILWLQTSGVPVLDAKKNLLGYIGVTTDITKQKTTESELMRLSYFDGLTGIANRRYFEDIAKREWRRALREESVFSLLMGDIDFFKPYNDLYGHLEGDECLRKVAAVLKDNLRRPGDMIARYGGEEFVILLPDTDAKNATSVAETLRSSVELLGVEHKDSYVSDVITISVGVASVVPAENLSLSTLISSADRALYRAKKAGRNRVATVDLAASPA